MNSLGSSSKWPSFDSIPSNSSFLHSESEQTEDETDAFSEGEVDSGITKPLSADEGLSLSGLYLQLAHPYPPHLKSRSDKPSQWPDRTQQTLTATSPGASTFSSTTVTPGDLIFAQKCASLHRFIRPLLHLLHGLKTGRFDKGLSSFQQSVAMDRLQRILGILQRPEMGEKYLRNLLQIEVMLKIWFPQVAFQSDTPNQTSIPRLQTKWEQNQLHMPVKKRKLSWSDHNHAGKVPVKHKLLQHGKSESCWAAATLDTVSASMPGSPKKHKAQAEERTEPARSSCEFTEHTVTLSRPSYFCSQRESDNQPAVCDNPAWQDSSVSSSNATTTTRAT